MATKPLRSIKFPGLTDTYTIAATDTTLSIAGDPADAKATGDALAAKAVPTGSYEGLTAGSAEQLLATTGAADSAPYTLRQTGGGVAVGDRAEEKIVGGTIAWNQLVDSGTTSVTLTSGRKYISYIGGTWACGASDGTALTVTGGTDMVFDLTQMFAGTVANAVYDLEQATTGAGVAWFRAMFPESYYPYNAGELMSVQTSGKTATSADGTVVKTYPLDSSLILRGVPKWDSVEGAMYYDGDQYTSDGRVTRRYGIVDLGDQTWYAVDGREGGFRFPPQIAAKKAINATTPANVLCPKYVTSGTGSAVMASGNIGIDATWGYVYLMDSAFASYTVDQVKAALSGVFLVYELATPATDPAAPYTGTQWVEAGGTEAFIDAGTETGRVAVPVGHDTFYPTDLRGKIERLPSDFSTLIAPTEVTYTATRNYAVNALLIVDNTLYQVTSAIATGGTITPGTNVQATTLSELIAALQQ